jgi:hypothetical protein
MFPTRHNICTREYLPVHSSQELNINAPPGLTWIPVSSLVPPSRDVYVLSVTDPLQFRDLDLFFAWDQTIYQIQMLIPRSILNDRPIRRRSWNPSTGRSSLLNQPFNEAPDMEHPVIHSPPLIKQSFIISLSTEHDALLKSILDNKKMIPPDSPSWGNLYIRVFGNKQKSYYVQRPTPTYNGITIHYGLDTFFLSRIRPLSSPTFRFIYKRLSNFNGPYDWVPITTPEICILSHKIPFETHNKLTSLL